MRDAVSIMGTLPPGVMAVETADEVFSVGELYPEEALIVANAVPTRVREFAAGRACAHAALAKLGAKPGPLLANLDRTPRWPENVVGTITHTTRYCAVAVAFDRNIAALGIDAEQSCAVDPTIFNQVCTPHELCQIQRLPKKQRPALATMIFTAKEAFYKCQYTLTRTWLDFHDVSVHPQGDTFVIVSEHAAVRALKERWPLAGGFLTAGAIVTSTLALAT